MSYFTDSIAIEDLGLSREKLDREFAALSRDKNKASTIVDFFYLLYKYQKFDEIINFYKQVSLEDNNLYKLAFYISHAFLVNGKQDDAKKYLNLALKYDYKNTCENIKIVGQQERHKEFEFYVNELIANDIKNVEYWLMLGNFLTESEIFQPAKIVFEEILKSDPFNDKAKFKLAYIAFRENNFAQATELCLELVNFSETKLESLVLLSILTIRTEDNHELISKLETTHISDYFLLFLISLYYKLIASKKELFFLREANSLAPNSLFLRRAIANYHYSHREDRIAVVELAKLISINKGSEKDIELYLHLLIKNDLISDGINFIIKYGQAICYNPRILYYYSIISIKAKDSKRSKHYIALLNDTNLDKKNKIYVQYLFHYFNKKYKQAYQFYKKYLEETKELVKEFYTLNYMLFINLGKVNEAIKACEDLLAEAKTEQDRNSINYALSVLYANDKKYQNAYEVTKNYVNSGNISMYSIHAVLIDHLKMTKDYLKFCDYSVILRSYSIKNYINENVVDFNKKLTKYLSNHPSLEYSPIVGATVNSWHSVGDIINTENIEIILLKNKLEDMVRSYIHDIKRIAPDDYVIKKILPKQFEIVIWTVVITKNGYQESHIHSNGLLSGVYYVKIPDEINHKTKRGWLEFGHPPKDLIKEIECSKEYICPEEGKCFIFPSYIWHGTIPLQKDDKRICVAFDVIEKI